MSDGRPAAVPVLSVGAGPTGLVLALWLTRLGIRVRIVDKTAEPGTTSRALGVLPARWSSTASSTWRTRSWPAGSGPSSWSSVFPGFGPKRGK